MKIYLIKYKGANWWGNFVTLSSKITIKYEKEEKISWVGKYFFKKKDAKLYLKTFEYVDNYEIISCEV